MFWAILSHLSTLVMGREHEVSAVVTGCDVGHVLGFVSVQGCVFVCMDRQILYMAAQPFININKYTMRLES